MIYNKRTVNLKLTRSEVCALLLACTEVEYASDESDAYKWEALHDKIQAILNDFDEKNMTEAKDGKI